MQADEGKGAPFPTGPTVRASVLYFDPAGRVLRLKVSPEIDANDLSRRLSMGETVTIEIVQKE